MLPLTVLTAQTMESAWQDRLGPWLRSAADRAWRSNLPTVIVSPTHSQAAPLRRRMDAEGLATFNVRFWDAEDLASHLLKASGANTTVSVPADLRLLARAAAEQLLAERTEDASVRTLSVEPAPLIETLRILEAGGWGPAEVEGDSYRAVAHRLHEVLGHGGASSLQRRLFELEATQWDRPVIESLLLVGFDAASFPVWPLLKAAARASRDTLVVTSLNGQRGEALDMAWVGSWESLGGTVSHVDEGPDGGPLAELAQSFDSPTAKPGSFEAAPVSFACAPDDAAQAEAIARVVAEQLSAGSSPIAVVVPDNSPLAREVSLLLAAHGIAHGCSAPAPVPAEGHRARRALFAAIAEPNAQRLAELCAAHPAAVSGISGEALRDALLRATDDLLIPSLPVVAAHLAKSTRDAARAAGSFARDWPSFPESAPLSEFVESAGALAIRLGMLPLQRSLAVAGARLASLGSTVVSKAAFCEWAEAVTAELLNAPPPESIHAAAPVQILRLREALHERWAHAVLAGHNEGVAPAPVRGSGLFSEESIERLNAQARSLNAQGLGEGGAGEGDIAVVPGKSMCLSPLAVRTLEMRDHLRLIASSSAITIACSLRDPLQPGSRLRPGAIFSRLHELVRGTALAEAPARRFAPGLSAPAPTGEAEDLAAVRRAYLARRDPTRPSGIHDFCLECPTTRPVRLAASEWGRVVRFPATQWLSSFVGVSLQRRTEASPWGRAVGVWIHDWIQSAGGTGANPRAEWTARTEAAAAAFRSEIEAAGGGSVPAWWSCLWGQALAKARLLARSLGTVELPFVASEHPMPFLEVPVGPGLTLPVGGRTDLVFCDRLPSDSGAMAGANILVVDLKTGSDRPLSLSRLEQGEGVQLGLYGLRARAAGAANAGLCLLTPGDSAEAQVSAEEAAGLGALWSTFAIMLGRGAFGQLETLRDEFSHAPELPLATLAVPPRILQARRENLLRSVSAA